MKLFFHCVVHDVSNLYFWEMVLGEVHHVHVYCTPYLSALRTVHLCVSFISSAEEPGTYDHTIVNKDIEVSMEQLKGILMKVCISMTKIGIKNRQ